MLGPKSGFSYAHQYIFSYGAYETGTFARIADLAQHHVRCSSIGARAMLGVIATKVRKSVLNRPFHTLKNSDLFPILQMTNNVVDSDF